MRLGDRVRVSLLVLCTAAPVSSAQAQDSTHSSGWIVIPAHEYGTLRARALPAPVEPELPLPVGATLTRVDYNLQINGELASGKADLTMDVLQDGWVRVPLPAGLLVREARIEGRLVSLVNGDKSGAISALLEKRGRSVLDLVVALPVTSTAGNERLSLPASASGVTRASVTLTRLDMDIKVTGGNIISLCASAGSG